MSLPKLQSFADSQLLAAHAAQTIQQIAEQAIAEKGQFSIVLAGGTTPLQCYELLAKMPLEWTKWHVFYGDERCLPVQDQQRNHQMVMQTGLLNNIKNHFVIPAELAADEAAQQYAQVIASYLPFDLVLLGMGQDGHTASLFPNHPWAQNPDGVIAVANSPKPPPERISLNKSTLQNSKHLIALISGNDKKQAVMQWANGNALPIAQVMNTAHSSIMIEKALLP